MPNLKTTEARPHITAPDVGSVMETTAECYAMADQCEEQAATIYNAQAREVLLEVAANWRSLGDTLRVTLRPH